MPIQQFLGKTFVAFIDISGFKFMMNDGHRAIIALDAFYQAGYEVLHGNMDCNIPVEGFFVSDCGILFVRGQDQRECERLDAICNVIEQIHQRCFRKAFQVTTSIAWGDFSYHNRIEFPGIEKNPIYGNAYVAAFADNDAGSPKLYPSECRLKREGLPQDVVDYCLRKEGPFTSRMRETQRHFYFEWMRLPV